MSENTDLLYDTLDIDPFVLMEQGLEVKGQAILKLGDMKTIKVRVIDIQSIIQKITGDKQYIKRDEILKQSIERINSRLRAQEKKELLGLPTIVLTLLALTGSVDNEGNPIQPNTTLNFSKPFNHGFWSMYKSVAFDENNKAIVNPEFTMMKLKGSKGQTIIIPNSN